MNRLANVGKERKREVEKTGREKRLEKEAGEGGRERTKDREGGERRGRERGERGGEGEREEGPMAGWHQLVSRGRDFSEDALMLEN